MSALLHAIIVGIENERITNVLHIWKSKGRVAKEILIKNKDRHKLDFIQSCPYMSVQKYITRFGNNHSALYYGHFDMLCDDCDKRFHTNHNHKNYLARTIRCIGDFSGRTAYERYQLCNICLKKHKVFYCQDCCDNVVEEDWYHGYEVCRRCGDASIDYDTTSSDSDGYDTP